MYIPSDVLFVQNSVVVRHLIFLTVTGFKQKYTYDDFHYIYLFTYNRYTIDSNFFAEVHTIVKARARRIYIVIMNV